MPARCGLLLLAVMGPAVASPPDDPVPQPTAGGRLVADLSGELDLLGDLWFDFPFAVGRRPRTLFFAGTTRTAMRRGSGATFDVRDLEYRLVLGWRRAMPRLAGLTLSGSATQVGKEQVDAPGQAYVRAVTLGIGSGPHPERQRFPTWRVAAGPVIDDREVEANAVVELEAHGWFAATRRTGVLAGYDLTVDGLLGDGLRADVALGPRIAVPVGSGRRATLFAHYQRSRNPLGIGHSAVLVGFEYAEVDPRAEPGGAAPQIDGLVAAGGGEGRLAGQLQLRFRSPAFGGGLRAAVLVDGNILTAEDTGELYYLYQVGIERPLAGVVAGIFFHHRSNHQLAEPGDGVTDLNVLELGIESPGWGQPGRNRSTTSGLLEGRARAGYVLDSAFGEDRRWHVRAGAKLRLACGACRVAGYLLADVEAGDVEHETYALGTELTAHLEVQLEHRSDEQFFGRDQSALLLMARYGF